MIKSKYEYHPIGSDHLIYSHHYDTKKQDGGCLFYDVNRQPTSWVRSVYQVRHGKQIQLRNTMIHVDFGMFHTTFNRYNNKGDQVS